LIDGVTIDAVSDTTVVDSAAGSQTSSRPPIFNRSDLILMGASVAAIAVAALTRYVDLGNLFAFLAASVAVALLASLVGRCVEQLGERFGPGATGVLQSALGNLPELFIAFFALQAGLVGVVQSALIGSIIANLLLVMGMAFVVGGLRHGRQRFDSGQVRSTCALMALACAALVLPSIATYTHSPAAEHATALSDIVAVILIVIFVLSLPFSLRHGKSRGGAGGGSAAAAHTEPPRWPVWVSITMLTVVSVAAALVSDWFVHALQPAMNQLGISQAFAGLVVVAIAGNAIENVIGIQLAARNQADFAVSIIVNSPLQIALVLAPALVLLSLFTAASLTLVFAPMLVLAMVITVLVVSLVVLDGESNWLEGAMLIALYVMIAAVFWWG
jgi:Ca2+:H+ antiporter